jgi:frataxin
LVGAIAHLVERYDGIVEVSGSSPLGSTIIIFFRKWVMFAENAALLLDQLEGFFLDLEKQGIDLDEHEGSLSIRLSSGKTYLISIHHTLQQVWVSSPHSGGWHFFYDSCDRKWKDTRLSQDLHQMILEELTVYGIQASFSSD